jgi:hypothetical protein
MTKPRIFALFSSVFFMSACGGSAPEFFGPAGFSFAGLEYTGGSNSACCGGAFSGLPPTSNMPVSGGASYTGQMRGNIIDTYRNGTVNVTADFDASTVNVSGAIDFTGVSTGDGIVSFNRTAPITRAC